MSLVGISPDVFFSLLVSVSRSPPHSLIRLTVSVISQPNSFQALYGVRSSSPASLVSFLCLSDWVCVRDQLRPYSQSLSLLTSSISKCKKIVPSFKLVWCVILFCLVFGLLPLPFQLVINIRVNSAWASILKLSASHIICLQKPKRSTAS